MTQVSAAASVKLTTKHLDVIEIEDSTFQVQLFIIVSFQRAQVLLFSCIVTHSLHPCILFVRMVLL